MLIGFYILTRMTELLPSEEVSTGAEILAVVTILVALGGIAVLAFMSVGLVTVATSTAESLRDLSY